MASTRDWDQMLKAALEVKGLAQKFIDFAHMNGAGDGGEGEEDLEELPDEGDEDTMSPEAESADEEPKMALGKPDKKAAILIALTKKKGKGK